MTGCVPGAVRSVAIRFGVCGLGLARRRVYHVGESADEAPMNSESQRLDVEAALRLVVAGTASETGAEFFRALAKNLALALGTQGAWVTQYLPAERKLRALGMWLQGGFVEHFEYAIEGTVCQRVVESREVVHIPERLVELFPQDRDLVPLRAVSYLGAPLLDTDGTVVGHLSVLDDKPMARDERALGVFEVFVARAAAEHRRLQAEQRVRDREEQLSLLIETALDAILVLDAGLQVTRANAAAVRLFGCTEEDLVGERLQDFLTPDTAARLTRFVSELEGRPAGRQQLWVPKDFSARRWDHAVFPAEATLSRFENRQQVYYTLILRNADERGEAARQLEVLAQEAQNLRATIRELAGPDDLVGRSAGMQAVRAAIRQVARTDTTVLITGETGTGKELVARALHRASPRAGQPLVLVNCAALPANLIESELFGHERGAFTGAVGRRDGRFARANGGTLFLDEIGELPLELQAKLLRVLQEGEFEPLGGTRTVTVDVRVIAATHRDLRQMVAEGRFREDLYFRLHVFPIHLPPLRERGRDIEELAAVLTERLARRMGRRAPSLTDQQLRRLRGYSWPGNVRELQNVLERALILANDGELPIERALAGIGAPAEPPNGAAPAPGTDTETPRILTAAELEELERTNIRRALEACQGRVSGERGAARLIGLPASTLTSRIKSLNLQRSGT